MSLYIVRARAEHLELFTDAACLSPDGTIAELRSKVWSSTTCPLAVTGRGPIALVEGLANGIIEMSKCGSVDKSLSALASVLDANRATAAADFAEIVVAAISETEGPVVRLFVTRPSPGLEACRLHDCRGSAYGGPVVDLNQGPLAIAKAAREVPGKDAGNPLSEPRLAVGGWIDRTAVTRHGTRTRRMLTWSNDQVGRPIGVLSEAA